MVTITLVALGGTLVVAGTVIVSVLWVYGAEARRRDARDGDGVGRPRDRRAAHRPLPTPLLPALSTSDTRSVSR